MATGFMTRMEYRQIVADSQEEEKESRRSGAGIEMKVQTAYGFFAPHYDALRPLWAGGRLGDAELFLERAILPRFCPPSGAILDLGCGTGANLERMVRLGVAFQRYVCVDISPAMLRCARRRFSSSTNVEFYLSDLARLPFDDHAFDFAMSTWVLEHVSQVKLAMAEPLRVLRRGAYLALLFHSLPRLPWGIPVRLAGPVFRLILQMRFLTSQDYSSLLDSRGCCWHFAGGLNTLLVLRKDDGS